MQTDFVASVIRKLNTRMLLLGLCGLLVVVFGLLLNTRYLYNMFLGPFPMAGNTLVSTTNPKSLFQYFVTVKGDDHTSTGFYYGESEQKVDYYYHALMVGQHFVLVKSKKSEIENQVSGAVVSVPSDVQSKVIGAIETEYPEVKGLFLPVMLDATDFRTNGYLGLLVAAVLGLLSLYGVGMAIYRFTDPQAHPALKSLARFGPLETVTQAIDHEMSMQHEEVARKVFFTRNWLLNTSSGLDVSPHKDIMWCYKGVTQHRTNGIPTHKTYAAHIFDRSGKTVAIQAKEADVHAILDKVAKYAPGVIVGYSDELSYIWQKERPRFIATVDERRQQGPIQPAS
jgi:hypothetical protein